MYVLYHHDTIMDFGEKNTWNRDKHEKTHTYLSVVWHKRLADHWAQQDHLLQDLERRADDTGLSRVESGLHR